ncbi:xylulose 5-phosphate 3-epimerase [Gammaproteobacteria bacterium LSUCC0112]|nr:xylulose 5-phosphate 3-epimerase [Gammaproteobacteria bacterium LSUCC0112]
MSSEFQNWAQGSGAIKHQQTTRQRIGDLIETLHSSGLCERAQGIALLQAADLLCNQGLWLTAQMGFVKNVHLDGRLLTAEDFRAIPDGCTASAINMVPAYVGYLLANALTGKTRAWLMGQGNCVAAIDAVNVLMRNLEPEQDQRYPLTDSGLSQLCQDFYSYEVLADGKSAAPLGNHDSVFSAGCVGDGAYPGMAELQFVHMPLPGQELVAFLSDVAFEEQRGSDWAPRWWRGEDSGIVIPLMIVNGARAGQRTTLSQSGGISWFREHLRLNGFLPVEVDGLDPAAIAWAIITMGSELLEQHRQIIVGERKYPVLLPYAIAETEPGYDLAAIGIGNDLSSIGNPALYDSIRQTYNTAIAHFFVPPAELDLAVDTLSNHNKSRRRTEKDHWLRRLRVSLPDTPAIRYATPGSLSSPMQQIDEWFVQLAGMNPCHRVRIGNPDEIRNNCLDNTLEMLRNRVTEPEPSDAESLNGVVITALNEEAVVSAVLANKQGLNLVVCHEAFAIKMLGVMRQEAIFARHLAASGREVNWLSVPILVSCHTWENGKNGMSRQNPVLSETWLGEMSDVAPVFFPFDSNTAVALLNMLYRQRGRIAVVVGPRGQVPVVTHQAQVEQAVHNGALLISHDDQPQVQLLTLGAFQLESAQRAADALRRNAIRCSVVAILEPGRFREPRDPMEAAFVWTPEQITQIIPPVSHRVFVSHTRAEPLSGTLRRLDTGASNSRFMGYRNLGGTLDLFGMMYANGQTWAHIVIEVAHLLGCDASRWLEPAHFEAAIGRGNPAILR